MPHPTAENCVQELGHILWVSRFHLGDLWNESPQRVEAFVQFLAALALGNEVFGDMAATGSGASLLVVIVHRVAAIGGFPSHLLLY